MSGGGQKYSSSFNLHIQGRLLKVMLGFALKKK